MRRVPLEGTQPESRSIEGVKASPLAYSTGQSVVIGVKNYRVYLEMLRNRPYELLGQWRINQDTFSFHRIQSELPTSVYLSSNKRP